MSTSHPKVGARTAAREGCSRLCAAPASTVPGSLVSRWGATRLRQRLYTKFRLTNDDASRQGLEAPGARRVSLASDRLCRPLARPALRTKSCRSDALECPRVSGGHPGLVWTAVAVAGQGAAVDPQRGALTLPLLIQARPTKLDTIPARTADSSASAWGNAVAEGEQSRGTPPKRCE